VDVLQKLARRRQAAGWLTETVLAWLPLAVVQIALSLIVYTAVQQDLRQSANDPQIQIAEDAAARLSGGQPPPSVLPAAPVDIRSSLAPYMIVYDDSGAVAASSAILAGTTTALPSGVLSAVVSGRGGKPWRGSPPNESRFTWQPADGVRSAVVVRHYDGGFVLVGRSLREVEEREDRLLALVGLGLALSLGATLVAVCGPRLIFGPRWPWQSSSLPPNAAGTAERA